MRISNEFKEIFTFKRSFLLFLTVLGVYFLIIVWPYLEGYISLFECIFPGILVSVALIFALWLINRNLLLCEEREKARKIAELN